MVHFPKTPTVPTSLEIEKAKASGRYNEADVLELLKNDFKNKCYICEQKAPTSINIEHFKPHHNGRFIDLKFDWNNLFWSCEHCNKTKGSKPIFDNILNCTNENHDVQNWISYHMPLFPKEKVNVSVIEDFTENEENLTENTVELLNQVYNGTTNQKTVEADNLRRLLLKSLIEFQSCLVEYYEEESTLEIKEHNLRQIRKHLANTSAFTAFKRWIVKRNEDMFNDFSEYL